MNKDHIISAYLYCKKDWDASIVRGDYLTHINYSFAGIKNGVISGAELDKLDEIKLLKDQFPHLKILVSVGGWGAEGFSDAASSREARNVFAQSAVEFMKRNNFDGIDIDWEYPCSSDGGIKSRPEDKVNFTLLLQVLREHIDLCGAQGNRKYLLTAALGATSRTLCFYDLKGISGILDYINLMTYDFYHGYSDKTGHHTSLYGSKTQGDVPSAGETVEICLNSGIPEGKLVIGCAFYGRGWDVSDVTTNGLYVPTASECISYCYRELVTGYIDKNGFKRYWDDHAKAPWLWNGKHFISYDDPESLIHKASFVKTKGLGGVMFWEYTQDHDNTLLKSLQEVDCRGSGFKYSHAGLTTKHKSTTDDIKLEEREYSKPAPDQDEIKRKLRKLKKLEIKIRFGGSCHAANFSAGRITQTKEVKLVWDEFFSLGKDKETAVKYRLADIASMSRDEYKNVVDEFFFNIYYRYYIENGINAAQLYDPDLLRWMGLAPDASSDDIKKRFRQLAKRYHPDTGGNQKKFIELMENYHKLVD